MARREPLITHVDSETADKVRRSAEKSGMSVSTYVRMVLLQHFESAERAAADRVGLRIPEA